jgi:diguanylate cyclase (GGDEF)-like protein
MSHPPLDAAWLHALPQAACLVALPEAKVVAANAQASKFWGRSFADMLAVSAQGLLPSAEDRAWWSAAALGQARALSSDTVMTAAGGRHCAVHRSLGLIRNEQGGATHALLMVRELAIAKTAQATPPGANDAQQLHDLQQAEQRIEALAMQDSLTGLPNRRRLEEAVNAAAAQARREGNGFALLFIDLDRFGQINDSLGLEEGDRVLRDVAQRIQACLRGDQLLARLGGDQFVALVQPADAAGAEATARRVLAAVARPNTSADVQFTLTCSIGIALAPSQGSGVDELLRYAEGAMRAVKTHGRAHCRLHTARGEVDRRSNMKLDHAMRQALVSGRFRLHYQPQVNVASGRIVGAEALLRWRDPELGDIPPGRFIPVAEDSGFIVALGDWVLSQAVRQAALWHSRGLRVPIAVNVSALQFQQPQFVDRVASVLAVAGVPASLLELELTESILVQDADEALHRLHALARLGVRMSIDDFGTGYSSLSYLKRFPIDKLKIDRSFVSGLPSDDSDVGIVCAILQMARALGMKVIAEGVETESQRAFLQVAGCGEYQGFLFAPALDALSFEHRLASLEQALGEAPEPPPQRHAAVHRMRLVRG